MSKALLEAERDERPSVRDTKTGDVLEQMMITALQRGGYDLKSQVHVGARPGGRKHKIDLVATRAPGKAILISLKWQQTSGTAEQKVPFEVISLIKALKANQGQYSAAYIVLGGAGWTLREFYVGGGLAEYLKESNQIKIVSLESFVALANRGQL